MIGDAQLRYRPPHYLAGGWCVFRGGGTNLHLSIVPPRCHGDNIGKGPTLGFKPEHIRLLPVTRARVDRAGATARFKKRSGAKVAAMDRDFERLFDLRLNWDA
jgi:hypothetical protein